MILICPRWHHHMWPAPPLSGDVCFQTATITEGEKLPSKYSPQEQKPLQWRINDGWRTTCLLLGTGLSGSPVSGGSVAPWLLSPGLLESLRSDSAVWALLPLWHLAAVWRWILEFVFSAGSIWTAGSAELTQFVNPLRLRLKGEGTCVIDTIEELGVVGLLFLRLRLELVLQVLSAASIPTGSQAVSVGPSPVGLVSSSDLVLPNCVFVYWEKETSRIWLCFSENDQNKRREYLGQRAKGRLKKESPAHCQSHTDFCPLEETLNTEVNRAILVAIFWLALPCPLLNLIGKWNS